MSKLIAVVIACTFAVGCSAPKVTTRVPEPRLEWPGPYEEELLYWCVSLEGRWPVSEEPMPDCETEVSRGQWERLPITVNAEPDLVSETLEAIEYFNNQVGFGLFEFQAANALPDIVVVVAGDHWYAAAEAAQLTIGGKHHGAVLVYNGLEEDDRADIMVHELGHLVGLRHDPDSWLSIMYPSAASRVASLERIDIDALRALYLR